MASRLLLASVLLIHTVTVQVVASSGTSFAFNVSQVTQCEPVSISFSGTLETDDIPTRITLIPSDAQSLRIDMPTTDHSGLQSTSTGVNVTFFPLPANTTFLVSLDRKGKSVAPVTNFLTVAPSDNAACLASTTLPSPRIFQVSQNLPSCQPFSVTYDGSLIQNAPKIQLYQPGSLSVKLVATNQSVAGKAIYVLPSMSGKFLLSIDGGNDLIQTLTVQSDASLTTHKCSDSTGQNMVSTAVKNSSSSKALRVGTIVGISIGISIIVMFAIGTATFVYRERRRYRKAMMDFALIDEKKEKPLPAVPMEDSESNFLEIVGFNPPYVYRSSATWKDYTPPGTAKRFSFKNIGPWSKKNTTRDSINQMPPRGSIDPPNPSTTQTSFLVLGDGGSSEEGTPAYLTPPPSAMQSHTLTPPLSAFSFRRHSPLDVPKDLTPIRLSFSSSSVVASDRPSFDSRLIASLPFEGLDNSSRNSDSTMEHTVTRSRKLIDERPFASRKKVTFADDVSDDGNEGDEAQKELQVDKRGGLVALSSNEGEPGVPSERNSSSQDN